MSEIVLPPTTRDLKEIAKIIAGSIEAAPKYGMVSIPLSPLQRRQLAVADLLATELRFPADNTHGRLN